MKPMHSTAGSPNRREASADVKPSGLFGSFAKLLGGSAGAQLLVVLSAPLLSRFFGADDIGILGSFLSLLAILFTLSTLRYEMAITLADDRRSVRDLSWLVITVSLLVSGLIWISLSLVPERWFTDQFLELRRACWLIPVGVFVRCLTAVAIKVAGTQHAFGRVGVSLFLGRALDLSVKLALGIGLQMGWLGLAIGVIVGEMVTTVTLIGLMWQWNWRPSGTPARYLTLAHRYRGFPAYNLPTALLSSVCRNLPVLAFFFLFGPVAAGYLELTQRVLGRPISVFGQHLYSVFYQHSADSARTGNDVGRLVEKVLPALFLLLFLPFLVITLWGPEIFAFVFGATWREAGQYAAVLAPAWFLRSIATPVRVFNTFERQALGLSWQVATLIGSVLAMAVGFWANSPKLTAALLSLVLLTAYTLHLIITVKLSRANWSRIAYGPVQLTGSLWRRVSLLVK